MNTEYGIPKKMRNAVVVGAIAIAFVVGSSALGFASGVFSTPAVDRVGTFASIEARLATTTTQPTPATSRSGGLQPAPTTSRPATAATTTDPLPSRSEPTDTSTPVTAGSTSFIPNRASTEPSSEPTRVPEIQPGPTTTVPHVSSSTAPPTRHDTKQPSDDPASDD